MMTPQAKSVLQKVIAINGVGNKTKNIMGGRWTKDSPFILFKSLSITQRGDWGEKMFEESFGIKCQPTGIDLPELVADVKTFTRAYERTKFSGWANLDLNPDWYFVYLIFPDEYQLYKIPGNDQCVKNPKANHRNDREFGKIDITRVDIERFIRHGYRVDDDPTNNIKTPLENLFYYVC